MRKILIVATMGFLLLLSASTVSAVGSGATCDFSGTYFGIIDSGDDVNITLTQTGSTITGSGTNDLSDKPGSVSVSISGTVDCSTNVFTFTGAEGGTCPFTFSGSGTFAAGGSSFTFVASGSDCEGGEADAGTLTNSGNGASKPEDGSEFEDKSGGEDDTKSISGTHSSGHEGIWNLDGQGTNWVGVTVSNGKIILLKYEPDQLSSALAGSIVGGVASLGFATDASVFAATFTLVTSTTATLTVLKCTPKPGSTCSFSTGTSFTLTKVFE